MGKYLFMLDPGHGGIKAGVPATEGKRSPKWDDGSQLIEGEFTRDVVGMLLRLAPSFGVNCVTLVPEIDDIGVNKRVARAETLQQNNPVKSCVYVSVHANAGGGHGVEIFTSPGQTKSDKFADVLYDRYSELFPDARPRMDRRDL